jgi:hypothetical protein
MVISLSQSRALPATPEHLFDLLFRVPPQQVFTRRHGPIPPLREVREGAGRFDEPGDSRTLVLTDGGSMRETLTEVDRPRAFGYRLTEFAGPLRPLTDRVEGRWAVEPAGTGALVTWSWDLHPRGRVGALGLSIFARFWPGYARKGLEQLERLVLAS